MIFFEPSNAESGDFTKSAVHCIVSPLLARLRTPDVDAKTIRKIKEVLGRVVIGLSNNKSVRAEELFPFVYATISPFIQAQAIASVLENGSDEDSSDEEDGIGIKISGRKKSKSKDKKPTEKNTAVCAVWLPATMQSSSSRKTAVGIQHGERQKLRKVEDGANAPKLTGSSRHGQFESFKSNAINEPASEVAVWFSLRLMSSCTKKSDITINNKSPSYQPLIDPFIPILTVIVVDSRSTEVTLVALKCLLSLLRSDLPSVPACSKALGSKTLTLLSSSGSLSSNNQDLTAACFSTLTFLVNNDNNNNDTRAHRRLKRHK